MKLLSVLLTGAALALSSAAANAEVRFGIMNEAYPPFFTKDASGKWVGWEIELMDAVCAEMKETCSVVDMSWDGLIPGLEAKKFDVIWSSMSITDERKKTIDFTDKYYNTPSKLIGAKDGTNRRLARGRRRQDHRHSGFDHPVRLLQEIFRRQGIGKHLHDAG